MIKLLIIFLVIFSSSVFAARGSISKNEIISFKISGQVSKPIAKHWFDYFTGRGKNKLEQYLNNGEKYKEIIYSILKNHNMPTSIYYVALIESGFHSKIKSSMGAVGTWQFMKKTGKKYGLIINDNIDERMNIYKSTIAASKYLKDLFNIFHDWPLALAAYNAGEYRVLNAIRNGKTRSYKQLCKDKKLPAETCNYVSKIWVVKKLDKYYESFGFNKKNINASRVVLSKFELDKRMKVKEIASHLEISIDEFKQYNPDIIGNEITQPTSIYLPIFKVLNLFDGLRLSTISKVNNYILLNKLGMLETKDGDSIHLKSIGKNTLNLKNLRTGKKISLKTKDYFKN